MARTSKSRGKSGFTMRSGNNTSTNDLSGATPYPFLGKIGKGIANLAKKAPITQIVKALSGDDSDAATAAAEGNMMGGEDAQGKLEAIQAILGEGDGMGGKLPKGGGGIAGIVGEGTALTKKSPYTKTNNDDDNIPKKDGVSISITEAQDIEEKGDNYESYASMLVNRDPKFDDEHGMVITNIDHPDYDDLRSKYPYDPNVNYEWSKKHQRKTR